MATALESASLVMIPSGYEEGTLGSLQPLDGTGDFTFSRGSNLSATRVKQDGYIEKGYENLLLQSNSFDTTWTTSGTSVTSGQSGYDGSNDAWLLETASNGSRYIQELVSINSVQSISVYAKAGTTNFLGIQIIGTGGGYSFFNLSNGTLGGSSSVVIDKAIELVSGTTDWYRCSFVINANNTVIRIYPTNADNNFASTTGQNIYIQDAQLNQGLIAYPYLETTTTSAKGGILENTPRIDYTGGGAGSLLLEPSRTNLILYSEYIGGWSGAPTYTNTNTLNPEGRSVNSFYKRIVSQSINVDSNQTYSLSAYAKKDTWNWMYIRTAGFDAAEYTWFDLENGVVGNAAAGHGTPTITPEGNGWYRCTIYFSSTTDLSGNAYLSGVPSNGSTTQGSNDQEAVFIDMIQCEKGSYPTSYIPTYGTSQTRAADILFEGATGFSNFFNTTEGTLFFEVDEPLFRQLTTDGRSIALRDTTNGEYFQLRGRSNSVYFLLTMCSPNVVSIANIENNTKYAIKWNGSEVKMFTDGAARGSSSQVDSFRPYTLGVATGFGMYTSTGEKFNNITFFPTALSDEALIELTTI